MTCLLHLVDRAERGSLLPAEAQQLRAGIRALLDNTPAHGPVRPREGLAAAERPEVPTEPGTGDGDANAGDERRERYDEAIKGALPLANTAVTRAMALADGEISEALRVSDEATSAMLRERDEENVRLRWDLMNREMASERLQDENARLRAELKQAEADVDNRDQQIRHLENGLVHERSRIDRVRHLADLIAAGAPWTANHQNTAARIRTAANTTDAECRRCHCPADSPQCDHCNCCDVPDQPA